MVAFGARRVWVARLAAPAAFLLAATVAVLAIRAGLSRGEEGEQAATPAAATTTTRGAQAGRATQTNRRERASRRARRPRQPPARANFYTIESGDTFAIVADKYGTSVEALLELNPGVDPTQLAVGQRIRVP